MDYEPEENNALMSASAILPVLSSVYALKPYNVRSDAVSCAVPVKVDATHDALP